MLGGISKLLLKLGGTQQEMVFYSPLLCINLFHSASEKLHFQNVSILGYVEENSTPVKSIIIEKKKRERSREEGNCKY